MSSAHQSTTELVHTFDENFIVSTKNHVYTTLSWRYNSDVENASFPSFHFKGIIK